MLFISYSHVDSEWTRDILTMAAPLTRYGGVQAFSDSDIDAGANWRSTIRTMLNKATVALLLVSRHFLSSKFIMDEELPYVLQARRDRQLVVLWVLVSDCLYKETPLEILQAALPVSRPLEAMTKAEKSAALKKLCEKIAKALKDAEVPYINWALNGTKVAGRVENMKVLARPALRRTEIFVRPENTELWYHQGSVMPGKDGRTCYFGNEKTRAGSPYRIIASTTDAAPPPPKGKPAPLPKYRTISKEIRVIRS
jgi:TIR domain